MNRLNNLLLLMLPVLLLLACNQSSKSPIKNDNPTKVDADFIQQGMIVVCVGGDTYYTSQAWYGGCGDADVDYVIYNVERKIGEVYRDGDNNDNINRKLSLVDTKVNMERARNFYLKASIKCDCGDGIIVVCNSDIGSCEDICDEANGVVKKTLDPLEK